MLDHLPELPPRWHGLWERTLLERYGPGSLTSDRPARVYWLQTPQWHADIRIPLERPSFDGVAALAACDHNQLSFIAGQEAFCGLTRVDGKICTWLRMFDLNPGTSLDVARMDFSHEGLIVETGIAEKYVEHWSLTAGSKPGRETPEPVSVSGQAMFLASGNWGIHIALRPEPADEFDLYCHPGKRSREHLIWQSSLCLSLCEHAGGAWNVRLSTFPWLEGRIFEQGGRLAACA